MSYIVYIYIYGENSVFISSSRYILCTGIYIEKYYIIKVIGNLIYFKKKMYQVQS